MIPELHSSVLTLRFHCADVERSGTPALVLKVVITQNWQHHQVLVPGQVTPENKKEILIIESG